MIRQSYKFALLPNIKFGITKLLKNIDHNWNTKHWAALTLKRTTISLKTKNIGLKKKSYSDIHLNHRSADQCQSLESLFQTVLFQVKYFYQILQL